MDVQVNATVSAISAKVDNFKNEIESINHNINVFKRQLEDLCKKPDVPEDFKSYKSITENNFKDLYNKIEGLTSSLNPAKTSIAQMKSQIGFHDEDFSEQMKLIEKLSVRIEQINNDLSQKLKTFITSLSNRLNEHEAKQKTETESLRSQLETLPKSILESNETILLKLQTATLDAENAMSKVNNNELHIRVLERKLENLFIQFKKVELALKP